MNRSSLIFALLAVMFVSTARAFLREFHPLVAVTKHSSPLPNRATRLFSSVDIADPGTVLELFQKSKHTVILDVRSDEEIVNQGFIQTTPNNPWLQVSCTPADCPLLTVAAENMIPDKSSTQFQSVVIRSCNGLLVSSVFMSSTTKLISSLLFWVFFCCLGWNLVRNSPHFTQNSTHRRSLCFWHEGCQGQGNSRSSGLHKCFECRRIWWSGVPPRSSQPKLKTRSRQNTVRIRTLTMSP